MNANQLNQLEKDLIKKYRAHWDKNPPPESVFPIPPAIPAIGNRQSTRVLSLASCENISRGDFIKLKSNFDNNGFECVVSRARYPDNPESSFFPFRHITPFNKGAQFIITWFAITHLGMNPSTDILTFSEQISTGNPFKFTISREAKDPNIDPGSSVFVQLSVPYLIEDLKVISPEVVIIPKTRFQVFQNYYGWKDMLAKAGISHRVRFLFIEQAVARRINISFDPKSIDCDRIALWISKSEYKDRIKGHLAFLKEQWNTKSATWAYEI